MTSYFLTLYPKLFPEQGVYKTLLESIPPGKFYQLAPITVPHSPLPQKFILYTDAWDQVVKIIINNKEQARLIPLEASRTRQILSAPSDSRGFHIEVEIPLLLEQGINNIVVELDNGQSFSLLVVSSSMASLFKAWSLTLFDDLLYPLQQQQESLMSPWSPELMESLLRFRQLLPDLRIPKTHSIKLAVRAMLAHSGTNLGVQAFATALAYNNPYVVGISNQDFLSLDYNLKLWQDEVAGSEFHLWLPSKAEIGWLAFSRLVKNLPNVWDVGKITEPEDIITDLLAQGRIEQHAFTFQNTGGPDFYEIIREIPRMKIGVHNTRTVTRCLGMYNYRYPLGLKVQYPIGNHILGRRPRHLGPIEAKISAIGMIVPSALDSSPISSVGTGWGVNPPVAQDITSDVRVDTVALADDGDISYIYHSGGGGLPTDFTIPPNQDGIQGYRIDVESIPDDAINISFQVRVVARGVGTNTLGIYSWMKRSGDPNPPLVNLWRGTLTSAYSTITTPSPSWTPALTKQDLASAVFYVSDESTGIAFVRVTELRVTVTYTTPVSLEVMGTRITVPVEFSWSAPQVISAVGAKIESIKNLLQLDVTYPTPTSIDLVYNPILDVYGVRNQREFDNGRVIKLKVLSTPAPTFLTMSVEPIRGHRLGTNDDVDQWAAYDHDFITATYTDPVTRIESRSTFKPEIGFLGHSLTSTRMSGWHQQGITAQFGTMSGYYPASRNIGVGSINATTKRFTFPSYTFTNGDIGKNIIVTRATSSRNVNTFKITSIYSAHVAVCANAVVLDDTSVSAKLVYKCQERRPDRIRGPQARLLTTSRDGIPT